MDSSSENTIPEIDRASPSESGLGKRVDTARTRVLHDQSVTADGFTDETGFLDRDANFGHYRLILKLGEGGMGAVYQALHTNLDKVVAIKLLSHKRLGDANSIRRFEREIKAAGRLNHPNIVAALDGGQIDGQHYLAMQFVNGIDVQRLCRVASDESGRLPIPIAVEIIRQAALGLDHLHQQRIIHRDVKPGNLMIGRDGVVKVLDVGLAAVDLPTNAPIATASNRTELTTPGMTMGTLGYLSPEQALDSREVDSRADIYSLGVTFYKLLSGQLPFPVDVHDTAGKMLVAIATQTPSPITDFRSDLPEHLVGVLNRMLAKKPVDRFETAAAVAEALIPAEFPDLGAFVSKIDQSETAGLVEVGRDDVSRSGRRSMPHLVVLAVVLCFASVLGLSSILSQSNGSTKTTPVSSAEKTVSQNLATVAKRIASGDWEYRVSGKLPPTINSPDYENSADLSGDRLTMVCSSAVERPGSMGGADLWVYDRKSEHAPWGQPVNLGPRANTDGNEVLPSISHDGNSLIFTRAVGESKKAYSTHRKSRNAPWSAAVQCEFNRGFQPSADMTSDGLACVVCMKQDSFDLFIVRRADTHSSWSEPVSVGLNINTGLNEVSGTISDDGSVLVFAREEPNYDLWVSVRDGWDDEFDSVRRLSSICRHPGFEKHPRLSPDGETLYFTAIRGSDPIHDVYIAKLVKKD